MIFPPPGNPIPGAYRAPKPRGGGPALPPDRSPQEGVEVPERGLRLAPAALGLGEAAAVLLFRDRRDEAPVGVDRLEGSLLGGDVAGEGPDHGAFGHRYGFLAAGEAGGVRAGEVAHGRALRVALDAGELPGEEEGGFAEGAPYLHRRLQHAVRGQV